MPCHVLEWRGGQDQVQRVNDVERALRFAIAAQRALQDVPCVVVRVAKPGSSEKADYPVDNDAGPCSGCAASSVWVDRHATTYLSARLAADAAPVTAQLGGQMCSPRIAKVVPNERILTPRGPGGISSSIASETGCI